MKKFVIALAALALLAPGALAADRDEAARIARDAAGGAEVVRVERDGGVYEVELRGADARYRVNVLERTGAVLEIETVHPGAGGALSFGLTEDEARAAAAAAVPEAAEGVATRERGAEGATYALFYSAPGAVGEVAVNAETGAVVRTATYPEAAARGVLSAARAAELVDGRRSGARIVELELDWDDGRYVYEGEAEADGARWSFEMDAASGRFLEFERGD